MKTHGFDPVSAGLMGVPPGLDPGLDPPKHPQNPDSAKSPESLALLRNIFFGQNFQNVCLSNLVTFFKTQTLGEFDHIRITHTTLCPISDNSSH